MAAICANIIHQHHFFFIVRLGTVLTLDGTSPGLDVPEYLDADPPNALTVGEN